MITVKEAKRQLMRALVSCGFSLVPLFYAFVLFPPVYGFKQEDWFLWLLTVIAMIWMHRKGGREYDAFVARHTEVIKPPIIRSSVEIESSHQATDDKRET